MKLIPPMKNLTLILWLFLVWVQALPLHAQNENNQHYYYIHGQAFNPVTRERLQHVFAELLTTDSVVVDTMTTTETLQVNGQRGPWMFDIAKHPEQPYIVRLSKEGYQTVCINIPKQPVRVQKSTFEVITIKHAFMKRAPRKYHLGQATVTASKVVFYQKGDTVVYNADALALSEGSMLDAIIRQLPGVEMREGGEIYVNGRYVEQLLLNGKDFFDKDRQLMLDNLPSYMVKNVKVYEKESDLNKFTGLKVDEKKLVMDVNLKKEYNIGFVLNAEAGYGTENRYLARLFAMRFTPLSRLTIVGNINNVNDSRRPGQNTSWTPDKMPIGTRITKMGGFDYDYNDELSGISFSSNFTGTHTTQNNYSEQSNELFLEGNNTFGRSLARSHVSNTRLDTHQRLKFKKGSLYADLWFYGGYLRNRNRSRSASATFSDNPDNYLNGHVLDTLQGPASGNFLRKLALNRTLNEAKRQSQTGHGNVDFTMFYKRTFLSTCFDFNVNDEKFFEHYALDYPSSNKASDYQNRYNRNQPYYKLNYRLSLSQFFLIGPNLQIIPSYSLNASWRNQHYAQHRLERLAGWGAGNEHPLGMLPSEAEWLKNETYDQVNSYITELKPIDQTAQLRLAYEKADSNNNRWNLSLSIPLNIKTQRVYHKRHTYDAHRTIHNVYATPTFNASRRWDKSQKEWNYSYSMGVRTPDFLTHLIDLPNDANPLYVTTGNPHLKSEISHVLNTSLKWSNSEKQRSYFLSLGITFNTNAIAQGMTYDRTTGARYFRPQNVDGNYLSQNHFQFNLPLDRKRRLTLASRLFFQLQHSVDLITNTDHVGSNEAFSSRPTRSTVNTYWTTEALELNYRLGNFSVGANGYVGYNRSQSERIGFVSQNVWQYSYGLTGQVQLPGKIEFSTDIKMYGHRGFADAAGNTDDLVWNARLSRYFPKANLSVMLDSFDLLRQLSNRTFMMNSQGRFETYNNVLPSYFLAHIVYRFSKKPKE